MNTADRVLLLNASASTVRFFRGVLSKADAVVTVEPDIEYPIPALQEHKPDLVILEVGKDMASGLQILQNIRAERAQLPVIMVSESRNPELTIEVMKNGAYDIVHAPFDIKQASFLVNDALNTVRSIKSIKAGVNPNASFEPETIIGSTPEMQAIFKIIGQVAPTNATVLITGESGVGKELIARALYRHSLRKGQPFMAVNCAAIPESLLESELFGHEKGAFTGANAARKGKFEYCDEGTIFLDEVGEIPPGTQAKLLRVLQDGEFTRVGSNVPIRVNVRVLAATNRDPEAEILAKRFREDLFYRLNVVRIEVPALRERKPDIPSLALAILKKIASREDISAVSFAQETMQILENYSWPGNVRELENCITRAAVLASGDIILPHHLPQSILGVARPTKSGEASELAHAFDLLIDYSRRHPDKPLLDLIEHELLLRILRETYGNQVQASKRLGMARATLRKRIEQLGIQSDYRSHSSGDETQEEPETTP
jgi:two-component system nitrogen regulation response regulator GlnG